MGTITFVDFFGALAGIAGPAGGYLGLLLVIYLVGIGGQLVTRGHHQDVLAAEQRANDLNVAHHKEIIALKDERIALAEGEAERWKHEALAARGIPQSQSRSGRGSM